MGIGAAAAAVREWGPHSPLTCGPRVLSFPTALLTRPRPLSCVTAMWAPLLPPLSATYTRTQPCKNPCQFSQPTPAFPSRPLTPPPPPRKMVEHLFEDIFTVTRLDPDGKKFDRVSRIEARSEQFDMYMQLDVATEVYPMRAGDRFTMVLAPTLNLDGTPDTGFYTQAGRKTLADKFDYVMHGKLYKISEDSSSGQATKVYGFYEFQI
ncbi:hypothetical protein DAI22_06g267100 [Oryza sativa Japonica Group]|nr:hypothetical protein DAI22_06g267100 [Oryza sativa Japonica Group]